MSPAGEAWLLIAATTIAVVGMTIVEPPLPRLMWNASASAPIGLCRIEPGAKLLRGDMVLASLPRRIRQLAGQRHYLPSAVPAVKQIAALGGDRVCAARGRIGINGRMVARQLARDGAGRALPRWDGCRTLGESELFFLNDAPESFDGRYFGMSERSDVIGRAGLLWPR